MICYTNNMHGTKVNLINFGNLVAKISFLPQLTITLLSQQSLYEQQKRKQDLTSRVVKNITEPLNLLQSFFSTLDLTKNLNDTDKPSLNVLQENGKEDIQASHCTIPLCSSSKKCDHKVWLLDVGGCLGKVCICLDCFPETLRLMWIQQPIRTSQFQQLLDCLPHLKQVDHGLQKFDRFQRVLVEQKLKRMINCYASDLQQQEYIIELEGRPLVFDI